MKAKELIKPTGNFLVDKKLGKIEIATLSAGEFGRLAFEYSKLSGGFKRMMYETTDGKYVVIPEKK